MQLGELSISYFEAHIRGLAFSKSQTYYQLLETSFKKKTYGSKPCYDSKKNF